MIKNSVSSSLGGGTMNMKGEKFDAIDKDKYYEKIDTERVHIAKATCNAFKRIQDYELTHKMVEQMSEKEVLDMYIYFKEHDVATNTILNTHSVLSIYMEDYWKSRQKETNNVFQFIDTRMVRDLCVDTKKPDQLTYYMLQNCLKRLENPSDQFILLGIFEGVLGKSSYCELSYASLEYANRSKHELWLAGIDKFGEVNLTNRLYRASEQLFEYAEKASSLYKYKSMDNDTIYMLQGEEIVKPRIGYSEATKRDVASRKEMMKTRIRNILNHLELENMSVQSIFWSGVWYSLQKFKFEYGTSDIDAVFRHKDYEKIRAQYSLSHRVPDVKQSLRTKGYSI